MHTLKELWRRIWWTATESVEFITKCKFVAESKISNFYIEISIQ